ncbi:MAG: hypothetical protein GC200_12150 [Tepidisphaera sp.]|nr:hypothetical protein [Tepidisphaera sp.]
MVFVSQNFPSAYRALDSGDIFDFSLSGVVLAVLYAAGLDGGKGARLSILSVPYGLAFLLEDIAFLLRWVVELAKTVLEAARALAMRLLSEPIAIAVLLGAALIAGTLWMALGPSPRPY